jgi:hypothetical protein
MHAQLVCNSENKKGFSFPSPVFVSCLGVTGFDLIIGNILGHHRSSPWWITETIVGVDALFTCGWITAITGDHRRSIASEIVSDRLSANPVSPFDLPNRNSSSLYVCEVSSIPSFQKKVI